MSASFCWEINKQVRTKSFPHGTSDDAKALGNMFPSGIVSTSDLHILRAMHLATHCDLSLWNDIALKLEQMRGDDFEHDVSIRVWVEY